MIARWGLLIAESLTSVVLGNVLPLWPALCISIVTSILVLEIVSRKRHGQL